MRQQALRQRWDAQRDQEKPRRMDGGDSSGGGGDGPLLYGEEGRREKERRESGWGREGSCSHLGAFVDGHIPLPTNKCFCEKATNEI